MTAIVYYQTAIVCEVARGGGVPATSQSEDTRARGGGEIGESIGVRLINDLRSGAVQGDVGGVGHHVGMVKLQGAQNRVIASGQRSRPACSSGRSWLDR